MKSASGCHVQITDALRADAQALMDKLHANLEELSKPFEPHMAGDKPVFVKLAHIDDNSTVDETRFYRFSEAFEEANQLIGQGQINMLNGLLNGFGDHVMAAGHLSRLMGVYPEQPGFKELLEKHGNEITALAMSIGNSPEFANAMGMPGTLHQDRIEKPSAGWAQGH